MNPFLLPVVAIQGSWMRLATEVLPAASGPTVGTAGDAASSPPVRIAVLGESTAAGCGVDTHADGFPGGLARELAARTLRRVTWEVVGQHGATALRIRHRLLPELGRGFDVAVLLAGANDVLSRRPPAKWGDDLAAIVEGLAGRAEHVTVVGLPSFDSFPSIPSALGRYLAARANALDDVSRRICAEHARATWVESADALPLADDFFARDRFHPSAVGYRRWAEVVADHLMTTDFHRERNSGEQSPDNRREAFS
ncbi:SGNH/GDSL hydrolase family protein [Actinomycetes bacterium KLBMP 9759]